MCCVNLQINFYNIKLVYQFCTQKPFCDFARLYICDGSAVNAVFMVVRLVPLQNHSFCHKLSGLTCTVGHIDVLREHKG